MELSKGRIIFASINSYTVLSESGQEYFSVLSGNFNSRNSSLPAVGDLVLFYKNDNGDSVIDWISERKSVISRKTSGKEFKENVLASNIDYMFILNAMDDTFSKRRIERFLVLAKSGGVQPVILLTKADTCDLLSRVVFSSEAYEVAGGADVIEVSSVTGEGLEDVRKYLSEGVIVCAVGLSGAGKSTLLNKLIGDEIRDTAPVRAYDSKGKHCTTSRQMFLLGSGAMYVDTPGIREVGIKGDVEAVEDVFDEITSKAGNCFFADCTHTHEPSCAVIEAVESGEISSERYESYLKLRKESENYRMRTESPQERKRSEKNLSKLVRSVSKTKKRF